MTDLSIITPESKLTRTSFFSEFEMTGNKSIDMVAECVAYHRKKGMPLKAIILQDAYFELFKMGVRIMMDHKEKAFQRDSILYFDGVEVRPGTKAQRDIMNYEFHVITD